MLGFILPKLAHWLLRFQDIATSTEFVGLVRRHNALCCHRFFTLENNSSST